MPKATGQVKVDDRVFKELREKIRGIGKAYVKVGVLEANGTTEAKDGDGLTIAELAAIHEYGAPRANIPARSFIRRTFEESTGAESLRAFMVRTARGLIQEKLEVNQALNQLGAFAQSMIKNRIKEHIPPPLKPATIKRKGSSTPLVDTGQLINAITWEIKG